MTDEFPTDASKRRVVVVMDRRQKERSSVDGETDVLENRKVGVLLMDEEDPSSSQAVANIVNSGMDTAGAVLVQSPFDHDRYIEAQEAASAFALQKKELFSLFCQYLGAQEVKITEGIALEDGRSRKLNIGGLFKLVGFRLSGKGTEESRRESEMMLENKYDGTGVDLVKAKRLLEEKNLAGDHSLDMLLRARAHGGNAMQSHRLEINLSSEASQNLKVAAGLRAPALGLNADFARSIKANRRYCLKVEVKFAPK